MKQAIEEKFILAVLANYVPGGYVLPADRDGRPDPEFDSKRASKMLRGYVEGQKHAIRQKAEIMVDHFRSQMYAQRKIGDRARAH